MFLVQSCSCLRPIHWSHVSIGKWKCSWSSTERRCSNYIWVINNVIAYYGVTYIRGLKKVQFEASTSYAYISSSLSTPLNHSWVFCFYILQLRKYDLLSTPIMLHSLHKAPNKQTTIFWLCWYTEAANETRLGGQNKSITWYWMK